MPDINNEFDVMKIIKFGSLIIAGIVFLSILGGVFAFVPAGHKGVLLTWGKVEPVVLNEGINFKTPYVQEVIAVSTQTLKIEAGASAASKDLQDVSTTVALNFHLDPLVVNDVYQKYTLNYPNTIIAPAIQESVKAATAKFTAEELITKRQVVKEQIDVALKDRLAPYGIQVETISITNFAFSAQFTAAIESKVTAEQLAQKAENDLKRIKVEAEQQVAMAKGEADATVAKAQAAAESIRIQGQALKENPDLVSLKMAEKWDGKLPVYMLGQTTGMLLNLNNLGGGQ